LSGVPVEGASSKTNDQNFRAVDRAMAAVRGVLEDDVGRGRLALAELRREIVARLRERRGGLREAVAPLLDEFDSLLASVSTLAAPDADSLRRCYNELLETLAERYDALDAAVRESEIPFAEIDGTGRITYANAAFENLVAPARRQFATLFDSRPEEVQHTLDLGRNSSLRVELRRDGRLQQFRLEVGPLRDEDGAAGNYALLLSQRAEELRQEAALDGILRTDMSGIIKFANPKAEQLLNSDTGQLIGRRLGDLFTAGLEGGTNPTSGWLEASRGVMEVVQMAGFAGEQPRPVRVSVMPDFDEPGHQSGLLLSFCSLSEETAREKLRSLLTLHRDPKVVIREAIRTLRAAIPFQMATFGVYSEDMRAFRALIVDPEPRWQWSTRWFEVTPDVVEWLRSGETYNNDLSRFMERRAPDQQDDPVVQAIEKDKLSRFLVLPIADAGGGFRSALSLLSRDHMYGPNDLRTLKELGLEEILQAADAAMDRARAAAIGALRERLNAAQSSHDLALTLTKGVVECFDWEYAAVFRVDRSRQKFELFEQYDRTDGELTVDLNYVQDLSTGMLGHSYRWQKVVVLPRVGEEATEYTDSEGLTFTFIKTANRQKSAMIVPLRMHNRIELLLDLESTQINAFAGPDIATAKALADDCAQIFQGRWHQAIGSALIDAIEEAAVIVDSAGVIQQVNAVAKGMFGPCIGRPLCSFGAEVADQAMLSEARSRDQTHLTLAIQIGEGKAPTHLPTLASQRPLNDDYRHRLWLFTNLREQRWERDWRYLDETVSEVARYTRAPLLIADSLLRGAADLVRKPGFTDRCASLLDRAASQLTKADLTFERLSETLMVRQQPLEQSTRFDVLALLRQEIEILPSDDAIAVSMDAPSCNAFFVSGWPDRLGFAFRSLLGAVLAVRGDATVRIEAMVDSRGWLVVKIAVPGGQWYAPAVDQEDPIAEGAERARQMVALAPEAIASAVAQHGGTFEQPALDASSSAFTIRLPPLA
jgi:PAS domain-containing protein